jgi:hypothetical protein
MAQLGMKSTCTRVRRWLELVCGITQDIKLTYLSGKFNWINIDFPILQTYRQVVWLEIERMIFDFSSFAFQVRVSV